MSTFEFGISAWAWCSTPADLQVAGEVAVQPGTARVSDLPPAERRRLNPLTTLALAAAERLAAGRSRSQLQSTPLVFGSSQGDGAVLMKLLSALRSHEPISPTQFHNSVHNSPAGYWTIGLASQAASTAIAADDETLDVALAESGMQAIARDGAVLMLFASRRLPPELEHVRPELSDFALAAWCEPAIVRAGWRCTLRWSQASAADSASLEASLRAKGAAGLDWRRPVMRLGGGTLSVERAT